MKINLFNKIFIRKFCINFKNTSSNFRYNKSNKDKQYQSNYNNISNYNQDSTEEIRQHTKVEIDKNKPKWFYRYFRNGKIHYTEFKHQESLVKQHQEKIQSTTEEIFIFKENTLKVLKSNKDVEVNKPVKLEDINLSKELLNNLKNLSIDKLSEIQQYVIPLFNSDHDILGCDQTGSGKTLAYLIPIINKLIIEGPPEDDSVKQSVSYPVCLVLVPTRELAIQVYEEIQKLIYKQGLVCTAIFGGEQISNQIYKAQAGIDIAVATPGRLTDMINRGYISLKHVKYLVMDEADRMLDMGFLPQLNTILNDFDIPEKSKRKNLMFSATFSNQ